MKLSAALVLALASSVSAIRILTPETEFIDTNPNSGIINIIPAKPPPPAQSSLPPGFVPCHRAGAGASAKFSTLDITGKSYSYMPDPIRNLLTSLGILEAPQARSRSEEPSGPVAWFAPPGVPPFGPKRFPIPRPEIEEGFVRILPIFEMGNHVNIDEHPAAREAERSGWDKLRGKNGVKAHHHHDGREEWDVIMLGEGEGPEHGHRGYGHRHGHAHAHGEWHHVHHASFGHRLTHALRHLSIQETTALAFVLGAGIGSILHLLVMFFILFRRARRSRVDGGSSRASRRLARRMRRAERKEAREARKAVKGKIQLEGEEGEKLPEYVAFVGDEQAVEEKV